MVVANLATPRVLVFTMLRLGVERLVSLLAALRHARGDASASELGEPGRGMAAVSSARDRLRAREWQAVQAVARKPIKGTLAW